MPRKKNKILFETEEVSLPEEDLVSKILHDFSTDEAARSQWESDRKKNWERYEGILAPKNFPWENCSNLNVPLTRIVVDTYWANLSRSFRTTKDLIRAVPVSNDDRILAEKRPRLLNYQLRQEVDIEGLKDKIFETSLKYGDCIIKQMYEHIERKKSENEMQEEADQMFEESGEISGDIEDTKVIYDGVRSFVPNVEDVYKPSDAMGLQAAGTPGYPDEACDHVIYRARFTKSEYIRKVEQEGWPEIDFKETQEKHESRLSGVNLDEDKKLDLGISTTLQDRDNFINILEWYGEYYNEKTNKVEEIVVIVHPQSRKLLKAFVNPWGFRPFIQFTPIPTANQPYGKGFPEVLKYLQAEINTIHNQRIDSETKRIAQPGFYDKGSGFNPKQFMLQPNGMYPTDGPPQNSVYFPPFQSAPASSFTEEEAIWRYVSQLTAVDKPVTGSVTPGSATATEIGNVIQRADIRFDLIFQRYERGFQKLALQIAGLDRVHMPEQKEYRILGSDGRFKYESIKKSDLGDHFDIIFEGNSVANELMKQREMLQLYSIYMQNPLVVADPAAVYEWSKRLAETFNVQNIDKLIPMPIQALVRTPQEENEMMYKGIIVPPHAGEDAEKHLLIHDEEMNQIGWAQKVPQHIQEIFHQHVESTKTVAAGQRIAKENGMMQSIGSSPVQANNTAAAPQVGGGSMRQFGQQSPQQPPQRPGPKPKIA